MADAFDATRSDRLLGVEDGPQVEIKVKGSRFLGQVLRAMTEAEAREQLRVIRKRYHDATHHGSAWRLPPPADPIEASDDDGEPAGTTGPPILMQLRGAELLGALCVVTRWFGGTKLGTGGLARAYGEAAALAVEAAPRTPLWRARDIRLEPSWEDVGAIEAVLAREAPRLLQVRRDFGERPVFALTVPLSQCVHILGEIRQATGARTPAHAGPEFLHPG